MFRFVVAAILASSLLALAPKSVSAQTIFTAEVEGKLERVDGNSRFTEVTIRVRLVVPPGADAGRARHLLEKSEKGCPFSNSLTARKHIEAEIVEAA